MRQEREMGMVVDAAGSGRRGRRGVGWSARALRAVVVAVTAAVLAAVLAAPVAAAQDSTGASAGGYGDVAGDDYFSEAVALLAADGVFAGTDCAAGFCPGEGIDRKTMAVWMARILDGEDPAAVSGTRFGDVDASGFHAPFIERMAALGVTAGCGDGSDFCGDRGVSRAEMAVFLSSGFNLTAGAGAGFADVPGDAWFAAAVAGLAAAGVTAGCGDGTRFCPDAGTTRAQMATFLARATGRVGAPDPQARVPRLVVVEDGWLSPDGTRLALTDSEGRLVVRPRGGTDSTLVSPFAIAALTIRTVIWSPDSTHLLFHDADGYPYTARADGSNATRLASTNAVHSHTVFGEFEAYANARWSPDGARVTFHSEDSEDSRLHVVDADGTNGYSIDVDTSYGSYQGDWSWAPDGTKIAYESNRSSDEGTLYVVDADGTNRTLILEPDEWDGHSWDWSPWSPDSTRIAYQSDSLLHVVGADGTNRVQLSSAPAKRYGIAWVWSPDASKLSYTIETDARGKYETLAYVVGADGSGNVLIAGGDPVESNQPVGTTIPQLRHDDVFVWSPSGTKIAVSSPASVLQFVVDSDGTNSRKLVGDDETASIRWLSWSPDGSKLAFAEDAEDYVLYVANADGSGLVRVGKFRAPWYEWSPDSDSILFASPAPVIDSDSDSDRQCGTEVEASFDYSLYRLATNTAHVLGNHTYINVECHLPFSFIFELVAWTEESIVIRQTAYFHI